MSESEQRTKLEEQVVEEEESGDDNDTRAINQGEQIPSLEEGPQLRQTTKEHQPSTTYPSSEHILIAYEGEPEIFQEVQSHKDKDCWIKPMREKMNSLWKNDTYELTKLPKAEKHLRINGCLS